ncbi:proline dehydrogenase family protein [Candidatus Zixiibacteriota bacterium]
MSKKTAHTGNPDHDTNPQPRISAPPSVGAEMESTGSTPWNHTTPPREDSLVQRLRWGVISSIPTFALWFFTHPYIAGAHRADALNVARRLYKKRGIYSTIDVLGEAIECREEAADALEEYLQLIGDTGASNHISISVKLSALGQGIDTTLCDHNVETLLQRAAEYGLFVRYDMEDHTTIDQTLGTYKKFIGEYARTGIVFQSMLFRTPADYDALVHLRPNVRGVIGIYREPAEIAYTDKRTMKEKLLQLFEQMWANGSYVAIATHDRDVVRRALAIANKMGKTTDDYEVQMLLGVPLNHFQDDLVAQGIKVRLYIPYGEHWAAYCRRRLNGNPNIAALAIRNLFRFGQ